MDLFVRLGQYQAGAKPEIHIIWRTHRVERLRVQAAWVQIPACYFLAGRLVANDPGCTFQ